MAEMSLDHFLVVVAKDAVTKAYGSKISNWPPNNYWAVVSAVKQTIKEEQIPDLIAQYNIATLSDYSSPER